VVCDGAEVYRGGKARAGEVYAKHRAECEGVPLRLERAAP